MEIKILFHNSFRVFKNKVTIAVIEIYNPQKITGRLNHIVIITTTSSNLSYDMHSPPQQLPGAVSELLDIYQLTIVLRYF